MTGVSGWTGLTGLKGETPKAGESRADTAGFIRAVGIGVVRMFEGI